ncbi:MAG: DUF4097 family beta strand repeat protein [Clostridia bacterium]|nr:DUF4097 family beta strand repeat protein [Clostridia bacterium]
MRRKTIVWLIIATALVLIGSGIFVGAMAMGKWNFTNGNYETNNHVIEEVFGSVSVKTDTADVRILPSEDGSCSVICYEKTNMKHSVKVENGTLIIDLVDERKWYEYVGIHFGTPKITVYLPTGDYGTLAVETDTGDTEISESFRFQRIDISQTTGDVTNRASAKEGIFIHTTTGDIRIEDLSAASLSLSVSTGHVSVSRVRCNGDISVRVSTGDTKLHDVTCHSLVSNGSTGDIFLKNVLATAKFHVERSTGDVTFDRADAAEIFVKVTTGDVKGSLLSEKIFFVDTSTGKKDVPHSVTGGKCQITTTTGDVYISVGK